MVKTPNKILTLEEFLTLPETKPHCEYIDGKIIPKPIPQGKHSTIQGELCPTINSVVKVQKMGWAFPELRGDRYKYQLNQLSKKKSQQ